MKLCLYPCTGQRACTKGKESDQHGTGFDSVTNEGAQYTFFERAVYVDHRLHFSVEKASR